MAKDPSPAWVWSQYRAALPGDESAGRKGLLSARAKLGIVLIVSTIAGLTSTSLSVLILSIAAFLIAWGQIPKRTEELILGLPGGNHLLNALAELDPAVGRHES